MNLRTTVLAFASVLLLCAFVTAQESVLTLLPYNGQPYTFIDAQFAADTTLTSGLLANRVYELKRDSLYLSRAIITIQSGQTLRIRGAVGAGKRPIIYLYDTGTGTSPTRPPGNFAVLNGGSLEFRNFAIAGYYEIDPTEIGGVQGGLINTTAVSPSIVVDSVIFSNINGQHIRTGFNITTVKVTNTIFANMGALSTSNLGAGKGIDLREATLDTLIVQNCTFVNYQDRAIRHYNFNFPQTGTGPIMYGLIDHNTFVNGMGFHGLLSLGNVGTTISVTNNLFVDGFALGEDSTDATRAAEWANTGEVYASNGQNRITWIFSAPNDTTQWRIWNNMYAISDSGTAFLTDFEYPVGSPLSWHINTRLDMQGMDTTTTFLPVTLTLTNTPRLMTNMMRWYEDPAGGGRIKNQTNYVLARDDFDRRVIQYYRDTLSAAYSTGSIAYTGAFGGYPVGDLNWFPSKYTEWRSDPVSNVPRTSNLPESFVVTQNYPNPFNPGTTFDFELLKRDQVIVKIFDLLGRELATLVNEVRAPGPHRITWDASGYPSGVYLYRIQVGQDIQTKRMTLIK
ncbi:MAG: T9SS type A sorting domain-containing protein [Bacteroidota bacterium]